MASLSTPLVSAAPSAPPKPPANGSCTGESDSEMTHSSDARCLLASRLTWSGPDSAAMKKRGAGLSGCGFASAAQARLSCNAERRVASKPPKVLHETGVLWHPVFSERYLMNLVRERVVHHDARTMR